MNEWFTVLLISINASMAVLIWMVQLVVYPSFFYVEQEDFVAWHARYVRIIACIVIPLMLVQAGCILMALIGNPGFWNQVAMSAVVLAWVSTFALSAPCHKRLQAIGKDNAAIFHLILTNWIRTVSWTIVLMASIAGYPA